MEHIQKIKGIERKAAEIEVILSDHEKIADRFRADLVHLRATIAIFKIAPGSATALPVMSVARIYKRGEVYERCKSLLMKSGELDTAELATACLEAKGLDVSDRFLRKAMCQQVIQVLQVRAKDGQIVRAGKRGVTRVWKLGDRISEA